MNYTLMHKKIAVAEMEIDDNIGNIAAVGEVVGADHLPLGASAENSVADLKALND